jgi:hypothetical protein
MTSPWLQRFALQRFATNDEAIGCARRGPTARQMTQRIKVAWRELDETVVAASVKCLLQRARTIVG